jgi:hypothetical protein
MTPEEDAVELAERAACLQRKVFDDALQRAVEDRLGELKRGLVEEGADPYTRALIVFDGLRRRRSSRRKISMRSERPPT